MQITTDLPPLRAGLLLRIVAADGPLNAGLQVRVPRAWPSVRLFWTWKSRRRIGRPSIPPDIRALIRTMSDANPRWGAPRIHGEWLKLGIDLSQATVAKYMVRRRQPPSQTWRTFLANHRAQLVAADFFVVPTATCRLLFVLVILAHERRRIVHVAVTAHPTAAWTAQQLREAFPEGRSWPGWQRHVVLTALAYAWLQHERGRRRARLPHVARHTGGDH
ncbi:MAG: hypothetical protein H0W53_20825 [Acidobacteria bacterium]|nr:hypothetical protein [Acidobacteriota bacterium]